MSKEGCGSGSFMTFLTGALLGAGAALLLTPKTGRETRELLSEYGNTLKENLPEELKEKADSAIERGHRMVERGRELIRHGNEIINESSDYIDEKKKVLNEAIEAGKIAMEQEKEALAETLEDEEL